jgi:hypothetical protein
MKFRFSNEGETPAHWLEGVRSIAAQGLDFLGIHEQTGRLYWDGQELVTRVHLRWFELILAILAAVGTFGMFVLELGRRAGGWPGLSGWIP